MAVDSYNKRRALLELGFRPVGTIITADQRRQLVELYPFTDVDPVVVTIDRGWLLRDNGASRYRLIDLGQPSVALLDLGAPRYRVRDLS